MLLWVDIGVPSLWIRLTYQNKNIKEKYFELFYQGTPRGAAAALGSPTMRRAGFALLLWSLLLLFATAVQGMCSGEAMQDQPCMFVDPVRRA